MSGAARIVVVGSLNHDITVWVPHRPRPDETLHGSRVEEFRGGKGANQAVAAARLGADVSMVGCVGTDARAAFLLDGLDTDRVDRTHVRQVDEPTGVALITVDPEDVTIVVVSGANAKT
ncbi:MAG: PfkB family carbohydrate kinase, partial [Actinomycetota bacterium]|nr:PfkB family carbohydrate kinase [Actinomycetota bacterium]